MLDALPPAEMKSLSAQLRTRVAAVALTSISPSGRA